MGIEDEKGNSIIRLNTVHATVFKLSLYAMPVIIGYFATMVLRHDKMIDEHTFRLAYLERSAAKGGITQSVNVGDANKPGAPPSAKTWLTTSDVAEREQVTERTVINYIKAGMIQPEPVMDGKGWQIAADFRIVPKGAEECGSH